MTELVTGQRIGIGNGSPDALIVEVSWDPGPVNADLVAFACGSGGTVLSEQHFIFFNTKTSGDRAVFLLEEAAAGVNRGAQLMFDLTALDSSVESIDVALVTSQTGQTLQPVADISVELWDPSDGSSHASYSIHGGGVCNCLLLVKVYKHQGGWKVSALGTPFGNPPKDFVTMVREYGVVVG